MACLMAAFSLGSALVRRALPGLRAGGEVRGCGTEMERELRGEPQRRFPREKQGRRVRPGFGGQDGGCGAGCRMRDEG